MCKMESVGESVLTGTPTQNVKVVPDGASGKKSAEYVKYTAFHPVLAISNRSLCERPFLEQIERVCKLQPDALVLREKDLSPQEYKELAEKLGIADRVCFAGLQKNPFPWLSAGSLYVGTSSMEGFPNALVEAMSCRLPAVFSNCMSGPAEILSDRFEDVVGKQEVLRERYGILIPVMDDQKNLDPNEITEEEKQLAALLEELLTEEAKLQELSRCAKERADQFDDRAYRDKILQIAGLSKM